MTDVQNVTFSPRERAMAIARAADGVAARWQLRAAGTGEATIQRWIQQGFLVPLHRGVYLVGGAPDTIRARLRAAVLRGGGKAHIAEMGALYLGKATDRPPKRIVLLTTSGSQGFDGVRVRRSTSFPNEERVIHGGLPCTSVARAIVDLSRWNPPSRLVRWMRNGEFHGTLRLDDVRAAEHRLARRGHGTELRQALVQIAAGSGGTDSMLEEVLQDHMRDAELPEPLIGALMPGVLGPNERVDFLFEEYGLVVEADGPHHLEETQRATDHRRNREVRAAGYEVLRFWWYEIEREPERVVAVIRAMLAARSGCAIRRPSPGR